MAKTNPVINLGMGATQLNQDPVLQAVYDSSKLLYLDEGSRNASCATNMQANAFGANTECFLIGDNAPSAFGGGARNAVTASGDGQLLIGAGIAVTNHAAGNIVSNIPIRYRNAAGAVATGYLKIYDQP